MADFNKIYTTSSLTVIPASFASLGFNDNKLVSKSKYSINENILNLYEDTTDTFTVFSNNGIATTYEFNYIRLNVAGVTLPEIDINQNLVSGLSQNRVLVFVDGELQPVSNYTVVNDTTLKFNVNYTNDYNKLYNIIVYSSTSSFRRISYTKEDLENLTLRQQQAQNQSEQNSNELTGLAQNEFQLPVTYEYKNTMLFINGHKIPFNAIEFLNPSLNKTDVKLNIPESLLDVERFDIIKFTDTSTNSINFTTSQGYLTYGPYDDYGRKIPNTYNVIFRFADQVKLLIDNVRQGFIIKEEDGYGEAVITDTTFESTEVKALMTQPFPKSSYLNTQYYLEVPECTSIVNYLAEFDKKYTFLPEILTIFQKLLLNDINDTIQRLRNARSIGKVDSIHINKLISLLGFNINIKSLNKKQRRELLEELNEFYRIAGTRSSYNLINILQNNLKLIRADQLFTPAGLQKRKDQTLYTYTATPDLENPGTGYSVGEVLTLKDTGLVVAITEVDENGGIVAVELETSEGFKNITGSYTLSSLLNGTFTVNSTPNLYSYNWETSDAVECAVGTLLWSGERRYGLRVTGMDGDVITSFDRYSTQSNPYQDITKIDFKNLQLYRLLDNLSATITSSPVYSTTNDYGDPIYVNTTGGQDFEVPLEPGVYYVEVAGAGGAGGAGDSIHGNEYDLPATNGSNGELRTATFTLDDYGIVSGKVGQGGGKVKARGHDGRPYNSTKGNGLHNGELGALKHLTRTQSYSTSSSYGYSHNNTYTYTYGNVAGGQGGGSTGIKNADGTLIVEARGGNGGSAGSGGDYVSGGNGGAGGIVTGSPEAGQGGSRAWGGTFWSSDGGDGWVKIYKVPLHYTVEVNGDTSGMADNEVYALVESNPAFTITAHRTGDVVTYTLDPEIGTFNCNSTFNLKTNSDDATVKLSVSSDVAIWNYDVKLTADTTYLKAGSTFVNTDSPIEEQFTFITTQDGSTTGTWTPTTGTEQITLKNVPAYTQHGTNGKIYVSSIVNTQKNEDRCYIDFYKKEEIGAEPIVEFRSHTISYGTITEGTPKSPHPWEVGEPDISYGMITEGTPNAPDPSILGNPDINYGLVSENTEGEWVEYWKWDRSSNWYPTNHVDLEMKLPPGVNFSEYIDTFIEQFYNLASTVVFIHQITESFYFGSDGGTGGNGTVITDDGLIGDAGVMTAPFGIVSTMPLMTYSATVTSDPDRQYVDPLGDTYTMTIIPLTADATVTITREDVRSDGSIIKTVLAQGVGTQTTEVIYGNTITYTVDKVGYITKSTTLVVDTDITKYVILESSSYHEPSYCRFTITPTPINADITFTACGVTTTKSNTIYAWSGNRIDYTVSKDGYVPQSGSLIIQNDTDINIDLVRE